MEADGISVGYEISCAELKEKEKFFWKESYGSDAWKKEKVRLGKVKGLIESISPLIEASVVGFGADSTEFIARHSKKVTNLVFHTVIRRALIKALRGFYY